MNRIALLLLALAVARAPFPIAAHAQVMDSRIYTFVAFDELEYQHAGSADPIQWDARAWIGGDLTRIWLKSEGTKATRNDGFEGDIQALYSRLISPYWEAQAGLRLDTRRSAGTGHTRVLVSLGFEGLAPYWFEVEPELFVSQDGDVSARLTASYDMFWTQRLIGQPRLEVNAAVQSVPAFGVGSGLNTLDLGYRLRYELRREVAPYIGLTWTRSFGGTADLARTAGEAVGTLAVVGGLHVWW